MQIATLRRLSRPVLHAGLSGVAALTVALVATVVVLPLTSRSRTLSVLTGSMSPSIPAGSLIFVRPVDPRQITAGDVITFHPGQSDALVTHRVVGSVFGTNPELSFRTKGDANRAEDPYPVPADAVVGKVVYDLPYLGSFSNLTRTPGGLLSLTGVALGVVFVRRVWSSRRRSLPTPSNRPLEQPVISSTGGGAFHV